MGTFFTVNICCFGTKIWRQFGNNVLPSFILSTSPYIKIRRITGEYRSKNKFCPLLVCLAQHPSAFTLRCGTDKAGRGALEPPPKTALERSDFTEKFQFRESHTEAETKKNSWPNPCRFKKNNHYIYISFHSCQILSPSETGFIFSAHRLPNITLLTLIATL